MVVAFVAPDDGPDPTSLATGFALAGIVAAAPIAVLLSDSTSSRITALGGGMTIAGAATTPGGNLIGLVMAVAGFGLLLAGASGVSELRWRLVGAMFGYAIILAIGIFAGLSAGIGTVISLMLATAVATSPRWIRSWDQPG